MGLEICLCGVRHYYEKLPASDNSLVFDLLMHTFSQINNYESKIHKELIIYYSKRTTCNVFRREFTNALAILNPDCFSSSLC